MLNLGVQKTDIKTRAKNDSSTALGRVYDVILDENHPLYDQVNCVGAIKFNVFNQDSFNEEPENLFTAFPLDSTTRTYPLKNEVVVIINGPRDSADRKDKERKLYYSTVISVWNAANHNAAPPDDAKYTDIGKNIEELDNINPLYPNSGDFISDGRFGNSIRLGGYKGTYNILSDDSNDGLPYTVISNGRKLKGSVVNYTVEDINKDDASIYLTSDHIAPLKQARVKFDSSIEKPIQADRYKGSQVLVNAGRLVFNAKDEDIVVTSKESLSISSRDVDIDGVDYISLEAKKVYLGQGAKNKDSKLGSAEPVVLGHRLEDFLQILVDELKTLSRKLRAAKTQDFKAIPLLNGYGVSLKFTADILQGYINPNGRSKLKSNKTFTE